MTNTHSPEARSAIRTLVLALLDGYDFYPASVRFPLIVDLESNEWEPWTSDMDEATSFPMNCGQVEIVLRHTRWPAKDILVIFDDINITLPPRSRRDLPSAAQHSISLLWQFTTSWPAASEILSDPRKRPAGPALSGTVRQSSRAKQSGDPQ